MLTNLCAAPFQDCIFGEDTYDLLKNNQIPQSFHILSIFRVTFIREFLPSTTLPAFSFLEIDMWQFLTKLTVRNLRRDVGWICGIVARGRHPFNIHPSM